MTTSCLSQTEIQSRRQFAICYRCDTFTYLQIGRSPGLLAQLVLAGYQHVAVQLFLQALDRVDRQVELNGRRQVGQERQQQEDTEPGHAFSVPVGGEGREGGCCCCCSCQTELPPPPPAFVDLLPPVPRYVTCLIRPHMSASPPPPPPPPPQVNNSVSFHYICPQLFDVQGIPQSHDQVRNGAVCSLLNVSRPDGQIDKR